MRKLVNTCLLSSSVAILLSFGLVACSGNTAGGDADDNAQAGDIFQGSDATTGTLTITPNANSATVSQTIGFLVTVRNAAGAPVANTRISCDTEAGLALTEPSDNNFTTNSFGDASGSVGCAAPGSFQLACRTANGSNRRVFEQFICNGNIPEGFAGFPGAGGGGLFGGVSTPVDGDTGGTGTDGLEIASVIARDVGNQGYDIDVTQGVCVVQEATADTPARTEPEPFTASSLLVNVVNNSNQSFRFNEFSYSVPNIAGVRYTSGRLALNAVDGLAVPAGGGTSQFTARFTDFSSSGKTFVNSGTTIPDSTGFRTVTFTLFGENETGDDVALTGTVGLTFANFNNCE